VVSFKLSLQELVASLSEYVNLRITTPVSGWRLIFTAETSGLSHSIIPNSGDSVAGLQLGLFHSRATPINIISITPAPYMADKPTVVGSGTPSSGTSRKGYW